MLSCLSRVQAINAINNIETLTSRIRDKLLGASLITCDLPHRISGRVESFPSLCEISSSLSQSDASKVSDLDTIWQHYSGTRLTKDLRSEGIEPPTLWTGITCATITPTPQRNICRNDAHPAQLIASEIWDVSISVYQFVFWWISPSSILTSELIDQDTNHWSRKALSI